MKRTVYPKSSLLLLGIFVLFSYFSNCYAGDEYAYFPLNEGQGTTTRGTGTGGTWDGRINGATWVDGHDGKALYFNGNPSRLEIGNAGEFDFTGSFTYDFWYYSSSFPTSDTGSFIDTYYEPNMMGFVLRPYDNGKVQFSTANGSCYYYTSTRVMTTNTWYRIRLVYEKGSTTHATVYVNYEKWIDTNVTAAGYGNVTLRIGERIAYPGYTAQGIMDELKIWKKAVHASQVTVLSPNGGERWESGSVHPITWTSAGIDSVMISYSTNNGSNWIFITRQSATPGSYSWTLPYAHSAHCLVKISDILENETDQSDDVFTIYEVGFKKNKNSSNLPYMFSIAPNPFNDKLSVSISEAGAVYSITGRMIAKLEAGNYVIDTKNWREGVYIVKSRMECKRVVKVRR